MRMFGRIGAFVDDEQLENFKQRTTNLFKIIARMVNRSKVEKFRKEILRIIVRKDKKCDLHNN